MNVAQETERETKQQPSMLPGLAVPGCCLVSFHFLCDIHSIHPVNLCPMQIGFSPPKGHIAPFPAFRPWTFPSPPLINQNQPCCMRMSISDALRDHRPSGSGAPRRETVIFRGLVTITIDWLTWRVVPNFRSMPSCLCMNEMTSPIWQTQRFSFKNNVLFNCSGVLFCVIMYINVSFLLIHAFFYQQNSLSTDVNHHKCLSKRDGSIIERAHLCTGLLNEISIIQLHAMTLIKSKWQSMAKGKIHTHWVKYAVPSPSKEFFLGSKNDVWNVPPHSYTHSVA